jgi:DNA-binding NtrC family response regulator
MNNENEFRILHLEDSATDADLIKRLLQKGGLNFEYFLCDTKETFRRGIAEFKPNVILCDHSLPHFDSVAALNVYKELNSEIAFILVTGSVSEEYAVEMMKKRCG